ncbi:ABC transporter [Fragilaria crotonensis]|nr:ABC transporter [Fragilaria crotonensis]
MSNPTEGAKEEPNSSADASVTKSGKKILTGTDLGVWDASLEDRSGIFSRWTLSFLTPLLKVGANKLIEAEDIGVPSKEDLAGRAYSVTQAAWDEQTLKVNAINAEKQAKYEKKLAACATEREKKKVKKPKLLEPGIASAVVKGFGGWLVVWAILLYVVSALLTFVPVLILNDLVRFFQSGRTLDDPHTFVHPWIEVVALAVLPLLIALLQTRHQVIMSHCAVFVRTAVSTMLYRKSLRVSAGGRAKTSTGQIVNMMSNDTAQLQRFLQFVGMTLVAPMQIIIALALIYLQVGHATWVGVAFMVFLMPINVLVFGTVSKMRVKVLKFSDLRVKMLNEILGGIRIIKFYAWEKPFGQEVGKLRHEELKALTLLSYVSAVGFSLILLSAPILQPILVFTAYVNFQDKPLDAATAFTTVALFNIMRFPFAFMPMGLLQYIQSKISLHRLERFLGFPELNEYVSEPPENGEDAMDPQGIISIKNGSFSWIDPDLPEIRPIQDEAKKRPKRQRRSTKKENVETSDEDVVPISATQHSIAQSVATSLDEEGKTKGPSITLQNLTCTINRGSLVAVVGPVGSGKSSFLSAMLGEMEPILGSKVYMKLGGANRAGFVAYAAQTSWVVNDTLRGNVLFGREFDEARYDSVIEACALADDLAALPAGDFTEIGERGINLSGGQKARVSLARALYSTDTKVLMMDDPLSAVDAHVVKKDEGVKTLEPEKLETLAEQKKKSDMKEKGKHLVKDEEREEGNVSGTAYVRYARAGGWWVVVSVLVIQGIGRASEIMASFWLAIWATAATSAQAGGEPLNGSETNFYLGIYALFGLLGVLGLTLRAIMMAVHRLGASKKLHEDLTASVLRAPVAFFDVTPVGRILNRFSADMDKIDLQLTQSLGQGISTIFSVLGAIAAIIAATKGTFLVPLIPIGYIYYVIQKWFRKTSTELQRVNSIANSPIFADFSQTLSGTSTIRAYGEESRFFAQCQQSFDTMNASYVLVQLTSNWLGLRLDVLGGIIGAFIGGIAVGTHSSNFIPAGWLGLALSYAIEVTGYLKHGVRMIATVEADMNSVERVLFYSNNIAAEAPSEVPENDPPQGSWPTNGEIEIKHASMRYRDGPMVLKDLSLSIAGGEKIGVVGRTGSGKSSLMIVLFRISELEADGGQILIDGVDVGKIGTTTLRLNLSIIPQDPVMFSNTIRYNLDPFRTASEEELWNVLKKVQMAEVIAVLPKGLEEMVSEGGENFSQGQRQLLCIARSLLRKPKILIMDEATASIDNTTDGLIQSMIRENFADATILTIAHRLNTIMDSDRVLVLDQGTIVEFDTPKALLEKKNGIFRALVDQSDKAARGEHD